MNGAFIPCLWPKHLGGFRPSRWFLIAGKIDHSGALMQPFYLQRKYKILFPWREEESDNRRHFACNFSPFSQRFPQKHSPAFFLKVVLIEFTWFCLVFRAGCSCQTTGAHSCSELGPPPHIFRAQHSSAGRNLECISFSRFALLPVSAACFCTRACLFLIQKNIQWKPTLNLLGS